MSFNPKTFAPVPLTEEKPVSEPTPAVTPAPNGTAPASNGTPPAQPNGGSEFGTWSQPGSDSDPQP